MSLFSFAFIFVASICFSLGFLHLLIFFRRRELKVDLAFSFLAFTIALSSFFELWTFQAATPASYVQLLKATLDIQALLWIFFGWFIYFFTRAVRLWPPILITFLYSISLVVNIVSPGGILFGHIEELTSLTLSTGEIFYFGNGPANPLRIVADIAWVILLVYAGYASIRFAGNVNRKKGIIFGTTIFLCLGLGYLHGTLIDFGIADPPYLGSFLFLPLAMVMSYSLAGDVVKASRLSAEVKAAEARWRNLLEQVHLMVVGVDLEKNIFYINPFFLEVTGYARDEILHQPFVSIIPEQDRTAMSERIGEVLSSQSEIKPERRLPILTKSGEQREIRWSSVLLKNPDKSDDGILSIGKDITDQVFAEADRDTALQELESLRLKLEEENVSLKEMIQIDHGFTEIIGRSNGILYVLGKVQQVAETDSTVLILGETGTGKELVARAIHRESLRADKPFIRVNCAAIPADLVESELFGHEPGSFTNAVTLRLGKFELAKGGTIFLDEISEMPLDTQVKLLHVLQEKEMERVGGSETIPVDVRVISATNRQLDSEVAQGRFRADLFYRLNVYPITIPPLRNRQDDIPLLVKHFIALFNKKFGKNITDVPPVTMDSLVAYDWPGNIRELRNILERAVITCRGSRLLLADKLKPAQGNGADNGEPKDALLPLAEVERRHILRTLQQTNWQISGDNGAAQILKINPSTLRSRIKKLGLKKP